MKTGDLTRSNLFQNVRIEGPDWTIEGRLTNVEHQGESEELKVFAGDKTVRRLDQSLTTLQVGPFQFDTKGDETVTVLHPNVQVGHR